MKKIFYLLIMLFGIIFCGACKKEETVQQSQRDIDFSFVECIGMNVADMCITLGIKEEQLVEGDYGLYHLEQNITFQDKEFTEYFTFDVSNETLYGGGYAYLIEDKGEDFTNLITALLEKLENDYGEPITSPQAVNRIYDIKDFSEYTDEILSESWNMLGETGGTVHLHLLFYGNDIPNWVQLEYRMSNAR